MLHARGQHLAGKQIVVDRNGWRAITDWLVGFIQRWRDAMGCGEDNVRAQYASTADVFCAVRKRADRHQKGVVCDVGDSTIDDAR